MSLFARSEPAQYKFLGHPERKHSENTGLNFSSITFRCNEQYFVTCDGWQAKGNIYSTVLSLLQTKLNLHYT